MHADASTHAGYDPTTVNVLVDALLERLPARRAWFAGISGLQASGKSTLAQQIAVEARRRGVPTEILALDDFYLGRRARAMLARDAHPLLATRGVPGTHDLALLARSLRALRRASAKHPALIPRFDKGRDSRLPPSRWRRVVSAPRLILLEGWCVGVPPQRRSALARATNALERREDADMCWRGWVNARLAGDYAALWRTLDVLIVLAAPDFSVIRRWRDEPERVLRKRGAPRALSPTALRRFLMHYERLSRHALRVLPRIADVVVALDAKRRVRSIRIARKVRQREGSTTTAVP